MYHIHKRQTDSIVLWSEWARQLNQIVGVQSTKVQLGSREGGGQGAAALASVELGCPSRNVLSLSSALYLQGKAPRHQSHNSGIDLPQPQLLGLRPCCPGLQAAPVGYRVLDCFIHLAEGFIEALRLEAGVPAKHRCPLLGPGRNDAALCASHKQLRLCSWTCMKAAYVAGFSMGFLPGGQAFSCTKAADAAGMSTGWPEHRGALHTESNLARSVWGLPGLTGTGVTCLAEQHGQTHWCMQPEHSQPGSLRC